MNKQSLITHSLAFAALALPTLVLAHGGVDDGHVEEVVQEIPKAGASVLLIPGSKAWVGLLAVSSLITVGLSYVVYRYIQVPPIVTKSPDSDAKK